MTLKELLKIVDAHQETIVECWADEEMTYAYWLEPYTNRREKISDVDLNKNVTFISVTDGILEICIDDKKET